MKILPLSKTGYQTYPVQDENENDLSGVIEITDEEYSSLESGEKCFNEKLTAIVPYYETIEEIKQKEDDRLNELRARRAPLLTAFDRYKINVQYGIETEDEIDHEIILTWYRQLLDLVVDAFENIPSRVEYYIN